MNLQLGVDASLIVRALIPDKFSESALALLNRQWRDQVTLVAPALLAFEVTSVLRRYVHFERITPDQGERAMAQFLRLGIRLSHRQELFPLAWHLAKQFQRPSTYDMAYLALAQLNQCDFWTADEKLYNIVKAKLSWVKWIGNYQDD